MKYKTANDIANQVGIEIGLTKQTDVFASQDESYQRMVGLMNACLQELMQTEAWQQMTRAATITAADIVTYGGKVPLPNDYLYMINQTGWDRSNDVPLAGPLSPQQWTYLAGRDLVSHTIYASFRINDGEVWVFPWAESPPAQPPAVDIHYEYASNATVLENGVPDAYTYQVENPGDIILFNPYLFERLLKLRFLNSKGFDSTEAAQQYGLALQSWEGKDKGGPVLNVGRRTMGPRYLDMQNTPDTGFGK